MKSLFLRIFLWFWIAMAVMAAVLVISSPYFTRSRPRLERWQRSAETMARGRLDRAVHRLEQGGFDVIGRRERSPGPHLPLEVFVFDGEGNEVRGREAPRVVREIAGRAATSGVEEVERSGSLYLVARPVVGPEDEQLVAVAALHQPPRWVDLIEPRALAIRLGALVLLIGAFSLWIARYLSAPVGSLRRATQKLSAGDLSARVGQPVDRRHDEIGELARDFDAMAERLEALLDGQRRLLRDVSHELRSPLARLGVALELARRRAGTDVHEALDRIERESARLDQLIGQLLFLERLEVGQPGVDRAIFDLCGIFAEVVEDATFEAAANGCEVHLEPCEACFFEGYPELLRSALDNVLRNAVRHTGEGTAVEAALAMNAGEATLTIRDHGPGVSEEQIETLFEPFSRVADARDRASGGVGLGLAISDRAVRVHGGSMEAHNHPGGGLEVVIRLPVDRKKDREVEPG